MGDSLWDNLPSPVTGSGTDHEAAKSKRPSYDAPTQQPMRAGIKPAQQRKPSGDQKKVRRQMAKSTSATSPTTKESSTMTAPNLDQIESDLMARMAATTSLTEQSALSVQIEEVRAKRRESNSASSALDWEGMGVHADPYQRAAQAALAGDLPPMTASERLGHTEHTDWLTDLTPTTTEDAVLGAQVRAEATRWYEGVWGPVKQDPFEFSSQAKNAAVREGTTYGLQATAASSVFLDHVRHLASRDGIRLVSFDETVDTYVSDGKTTQPVGIDPTTVETLDEWGLGSDANTSGDPKSDTTTGDAPSLKEGDQPESGTDEGVDNPNYGQSGQDKSNHSGPNQSGGTDDKMLTQQSARKTALHYSVRDEYDDKGTLTLWSGSFASDYEGEATPLPDGSGYKVELSYAEPFVVQCPLRNDRNWQKVDATLDAACNTAKTSARRTAGEVPEAFKEQQKSKGDSGDGGGSGSGNTCSVCGDKIAKDPSGENPSTWHHDNGENHDHEAKPSGGGKESSIADAMAAEFGGPGQGITTHAEKFPAFDRPYTTPDGRLLTEHMPEQEKSVSQTEKERLFPDGIPLHGDLTEEQQAWMKRRSSKSDSFFASIRQVLAEDSTSADGLSSADAPEEAPSLNEGDSPETGHSESPVQETPPAQDQSHATDSDRPGGGVNWGASGENAATSQEGAYTSSLVSLAKIGQAFRGRPVSETTATFAAALEQVEGIDGQVGGVSARVIVSHLLKSPEVPNPVKRYLAAHLEDQGGGAAPFSREAAQAGQECPRTNCSGTLKSVDGEKGTYACSSCGQKRYSSKQAAGDWSVGDRLERDGKTYEVVRVTPAGSAGTSHADGPTYHAKAVVDGKVQGPGQGKTYDIWSKSMSEPTSAFSKVSGLHKQAEHPDYYKGFEQAKKDHASGANLSEKKQTDTWSSASEHWRRGWGDGYDAAADSKESRRTAAEGEIMPPGSVRITHRPDKSGRFDVVQVWGPTNSQTMWQGYEVDEARRQANIAVRIAQTDYDCPNAKVYDSTPKEGSKTAVSVPFSGEGWYIMKPEVGPDNQPALLGGPYEDKEKADHILEINSNAFFGLQGAVVRFLGSSFATASKTASWYCTTHQVYVGDGNRDTHSRDSCNVEQRKSKDSILHGQPLNGIRLNEVVTFSEKAPTPLQADSGIVEQINYADNMIGVTLFSSQGDGDVAWVHPSIVVGTGESYEDWEAQGKIPPFTGSRRTATSDGCTCATNSDGTKTTMLCPVHASEDPCWTMARVTGRRRQGQIIRGVCTNCGWSNGSRESSRTAMPNGYSLPESGKFDSVAEAVSYVNSVSGKGANLADVAYLMAIDVNAAKRRVDFAVDQGSVERRAEKGKNLFAKGASRIAGGSPEGWWPRDRPSPHFPGETTLGCPKCGGPVTMQGYHGPGGRMGDPGGGTTLVCQNCGNQQSFPHEASHTAVHIKQSFLDRVASGMSRVVLGAQSNACLNGNHSSCTGSSCTCSCHRMSKQHYSGACADGDHDQCQMNHPGVKKPKDLGDRDCGCPDKSHKKTGSKTAAPLGEHGDHPWTDDASRDAVEKAIASLSKGDSAADVVARIGAAFGSSGGYRDSFDREHAFDLAAEKTGLDYNAIYDAWLDHGGDWGAATASRRTAADDTGYSGKFRCTKCGMETETDDLTIIGRNCSATAFEEPHNMVSTKASRRTAMPSPAEAGIEVGDIYYADWGYDQTNIDFYEVTRLMGASVAIRPIQKRVVSHDGPHDQVVAVPGTFTGGEMTKRVQSGSKWLNLNSYSVAQPWDGKPKFQTGYGYGH